MRSAGKLAARLAAVERDFTSYLWTFTDARTGRPFQVPMIDVLGVLTGNCPPESLTKLTRADENAEESMLGRAAVHCARNPLASPAPPVRPVPPNDQQEEE